ncbi:hypothetical protein GCM10027414_21490 [Humibacter ginsengiterrae]
MSDIFNPTGRSADVLGDADGAPLRSREGEPAVTQPIEIIDLTPAEMPQEIQRWYCDGGSAGPSATAGGMS